MQEGENVPINRVLGPLPESAFVAAARDSIPEPRGRVTTATTRGRTGTRGRGRRTATREPSSTNAQDAEGTAGRGITRGKKRSADSSSSRGYETGPGSAYHLLFGPDKQKKDTNLPDLNEQVEMDEFFTSQNAPPCDDA